MPHNYTPENLKNAINNIEKVLEIHKKIDINYNELLWSLTRIQRGMNKEFWLPEALKKAKKEAEIELIKERNQDPLHARGHALIRAKANLMKKEKQFYEKTGRKKTPWDYGHTVNMFSDFEFFMQKQWEGDRKRLIDEGEIKEEIKN